MVVQLPFGEAEFQQFLHVLDVVARNHAEWRGFEPFGNVGIVLDVSGPNPANSEEYLNLVARRQIPYRVIYRSQLSAADQQKLTLGSTRNPEAYQLYLKGEHYTGKFTKDGFDKGIDYLNQAIALDPNYALAYSALANNYINQDDWFMAPREAGPKARDAARKALALDESDAEAHVALAIESQWYEWDWVAAEREFKRAIELNPDSGDAYGYYSWFLAPMGRGH